MRPQDILSLVRAVPFRSFRIHLNSGQTYDVRHPEMVRVGQSTMMVFSFVSDDPAVYDTYELISLLLIERLVHIETQPAQQTGS